MDTFVVDLGSWLLDHKPVVFAGVAILSAGAGALLRWQGQVHARRLQKIEQAARDMTDRELELAAKLLQRRHLTVAEREELPGGSLRLSVVVSAARTALARDGFLPSRLRPSDVFTGVLLELRDDTYWVHKQYETGVGRHGPRVSSSARDLRDAVRQYVDANGGTHIDGVPIDRRA